MRIKSTAYLVLALAIFFSSLMPLAYKVGSNFNPIALAFWVALLGTLVSLVLMLARGTQSHVIEHIRNARSLLPFMFVGASFSIQTVIFSYTTHYISASLLAVIYRSWPLFFILLTPLMLREKITKYGYLAVTIGFVGMAVALLGNTSLSIPLVLLPFAALVLVAAVMDALTGAVQKGYKYELTSSLFLYNLFSLAVMVAFVVYPGAPVNFNLGTGDIYVILFIGIAQNVLLTFLFTAAFRMNKSSFVANAVMVVPFITIILDYLLLNEQLQASSFIIAISVSIGLLVQKLAPRTGTYVAKRVDLERMPMLYDVTSAFVNTKSRMIYDAIKGRGRALVMYVKPRDAGDERVYHSLAKSISGYGHFWVINGARQDCLEIKQAELDFIKETVGYKNGDILVLGIGGEDGLEKGFLEFYKGITGP